MTKKAYSEQLEETKTADEIWTAIQSHQIDDPKAFHCSDPECHVKLTYYGWSSPKVSHRFTLQDESPEGHHILGCTAVGKITQKRQAKRAVDYVNHAVADQTAIVFSNRPTTAVSKVQKSNTNDQSTDTTETKQSKANQDKPIRHTKVHVNELNTIVDLFNNSTFDNNKLYPFNFNFDANSPFARRSLPNMHGTASLNTLFWNLAQKPAKKEDFHIYYGPAHLAKPKWGTDEQQKSVVQVIFENHPKLTLYTQKSKLSRVLYGENIQPLIDKHTPLIAYFEGTFNDKWKGVSLTLAIYRSLFLQKEN